MKKKMVTTSLSTNRLRKEKLFKIYGATYIPNGETIKRFVLVIIGINY